MLKIRQLGNLGWLCLAMLAVQCGQSHTQSDDRLDLEDLIASQSGDFPIDIFVNEPEADDFKISPDAQYVSWVGRTEEHTGLYIRPLFSEGIELRLGETKELTASMEGLLGSDLRYYFWANNHHILFIKDDEGNEETRLFGVDINDPQIREYTPEQSARISILDPLEEKEDELIILMDNKHGLSEPFRLNIESGKMKRLAENNNMRNPTIRWMTDHDGEIRVAIARDKGLDNSLLYRKNSEDEFEKVLTTSWTNYLYPMFFDFDNEHIYASSNLGRDKGAIVRYDLENKEEVEVIFEHPEVDVWDCGYSAQREVLTWVGYSDEKWELVFLDPAAEQLYDRVKSELGDQEVKIQSIDQEERTFVVRTYSDRSLGSWYLYDRIADDLLKLAEVCPDINPEEMAAMKPISFENREGVKLSGYLTLPNNRSAENLPLVVNPHGGPWARNHWGFDSQTQFLASRGYAVLQVNFRGSEGFGREFLQAGFKEWGQAMSRDLDDGVKWLVDQGIADADRVAILGFSYGGYAALAGITYSPDIYACAISYTGIADLFAYVDSLPPRWAPYQEMLFEVVGHPKKDSLLLWDNSPLYHLENIEDPLLVIHGGRDPRADPMQSKRVVQKLKELEKDVYFLYKEDEGHYFRKEENRMDLYKSIAGFLELNLGPGAAEQRPL
jgi:dipeptidyl aminopeptidase/acylaminoacyl peptidase